MAVKVRYIVDDVEAAIALYPPESREEVRAKAVGLGEIARLAGRAAGSSLNGAYFPPVFSSSSTRLGSRKSSYFTGSLYILFLRIATLVW